MSDNTAKVIDVVLRRNFPEIVKTYLESYKRFSYDEGKITYVILDITIDKNGFKKRFMSDNKYTDVFGKLTPLDLEDVYNYRPNHVIVLTEHGVRKYFEDIDKLIVDSVKLSGKEMASHNIEYWNIQNVYFV
jgi:hypothetical protein